MKQFDFDLEDIAIRVRSGLGDGWREVTLLAAELIKLKQEVQKLKRIKKKVIDDE